MKYQEVHEEVSYLFESIIAAWLKHQICRINASMLLISHQIFHLAWFFVRIIKYDFVECYMNE